MAAAVNGAPVPGVGVKLLPAMPPDTKPLVGVSPGTLSGVKPGTLAETLFATAVPPIDKPPLDDAAPPKAAVAPKPRAMMAV